MKIIRNIEVPTGNILVVEGDKGPLEMLSLGDYGKEVNLKCDIMGLNRDIDKVNHTKLMPLEDKWVLTISTQYTCHMGCRFCSVPRVKSEAPFKHDINATREDLINQVTTGLSLHPEVKSTKRLNIHFARMGEPTWNPNVLDATKWFINNINHKYKIHPVVSTMMPKYNGWLKYFIEEWMKIKNYDLNGEAGLQLSINSTNEKERSQMFNGNACSLEEIGKIMLGIIPKGRKITLNFAVANWEVDPWVLKQYFNPKHYIIKLTPMHKTQAALERGIMTKGDYTTIEPYKKIEDDLKNAGYDVMVFIASMEEDESLISCGIAILSGHMPPSNLYKEI